MDTVRVVAKGEELVVACPYLPSMIKGARALGGVFDTGGAWRFALRHEAAVRELLRECYGTDGTPVALVTVRFPYESDVLRETSRGTFTAFGRTVARAYGRDSGAKLGLGCRCVSGGFQSGGSRANWSISAKDGTVVEMVDVPEAMALAAQADDPDVQIIRPVVVDRSMLLDERARLLRRLEEIEGLLQAAPAISEA